MTYADLKPEQTATSGTHGRPSQAWRIDAAGEAFVVSDEGWNNYVMPITKLPEQQGMPIDPFWVMFYKVADIVVAILVVSAIIFVVATAAMALG